jgi:hypothetical protein
MKEPRPGYEWVETSNSGYWVRMRGERHSYKRPIFCPLCQKISATLDDKYFEQYGICMECYIMNVENRENPLIDVKYFRERLEKRGY